MRYIVLYWFTFHHKRTIHSNTRNLRFLFFAMFRFLCFIHFLLILLISSFLLISLRAELECLTPLNSLLSVPGTSSSYTCDRSSAFRTANSSFDVSSRVTVNKGIDNDDDDNRNHSRYGNYTYFQTPISKFSKSDAFWNSLGRFNNNISRVNSSATASQDCMCDVNTTDGNSLKSNMTMSVSPVEFRSTNKLVQSTPIMAAPIIGKDVITYDHNIFNIARVKKVELHELHKVPEFSGKWSEYQNVHPYKLSIDQYWFFAEPKTPATNRMNGCTNNNSTKAINGNVPLITNTQATPPTSQPALQRPPQKHSNTMPAAMQSATEDGSVMKKIISLSVEQFNNIENSIGKVASTTVTQTRPVFVEKLHFSAYEQFEGEFSAFSSFVRTVIFLFECSAWCAAAAAAAINMLHWHFRSRSVAQLVAFQFGFSALYVCIVHGIRSFMLQI